MTKLIYYLYQLFTVLDIFSSDLGKGSYLSATSSYVPVSIPVFFDIDDDRGSSMIKVNIHPFPYVSHELNSSSYSLLSTIEDLGSSMRINITNQRWIYSFSRLPSHN